MHCSSFSLTIKEVRLVCSEGLKNVSMALFHPEIVSESNFDLESHFGTLGYSATASFANKSTWCSLNLSVSTLIVYKLHSPVFSLGTNRSSNITLNYKS